MGFLFLNRQIPTTINFFLQLDDESIGEPSGMKLKSTESTQPIFSNVDRVHEKRNAEGFSDEFKRQNQDDQKKQKQEEPNKKVNVTDQEVHQALETFGNQKLSQELDATAQGSGQDLKVMLKDKNGKLIRQMTGAEFVDLKQTLEKQGAAIGKMLDQKL